MRITLELPEDIAQGLGSRWKDPPRAALEILALEAYRSHALTAARLRRLLGFENRKQVDDFLRGTKSMTSLWRILSRIAKCSVRFGQRSSVLSRPLCVVRGEAKCHPVNRPSSADHWPVVGFRLAGPLIWVGDWSGSPSDSRVLKPVVQGALAQHLNDLQPSNSILRRSDCMSESPGRHPGARSRVGRRRLTPLRWGIQDNFAQHRGIQHQRTACNRAKEGNS
jgi:hypothetical protein